MGPLIHHGYLDGTGPDNNNGFENFDAMELPEPFASWTDKSCI